jgi:hypothetical protein
MTSSLSISRVQLPFPIRVIRKIRGQRKKYRSTIPLITRMIWIRMILRTHGMYYNV